MTLGEKLKMYRTGRGLSQEKVAELVGVSRQAVTKWENNQTVPSTDNLMALASIYQISLDDLAGGRRDGRKKEKEILHANLTLIGIILQTAFLNAAMQPFQLPPSLRAAEIAVKLVPLLAASVWMALNLRYEKDPARRNRNARIELLYCLVQAGIALLGHYSGWHWAGTLLLMAVALLYIFAVNPRYMDRRLTRGFGEPAGSEDPLSVSRGRPPGKSKKD